MSKDKVVVELTIDEAMELLSRLDRERNGYQRLLAGFESGTETYNDYLAELNRVKFFRAIFRKALIAVLQDWIELIFSETFLEKLFLVIQICMMIFPGGFKDVSKI